MILRKSTLFVCLCSHIQSTHGLVNLPDTPLDCRKTLMNFKKHCMSAIEPIRLTVVLFLPALAVAALCSPINKDQRFSLIPTRSLKAEVRVKDLQLQQVSAKQWEKTSKYIIKACINDNSCSNCDDKMPSNVAKQMNLQALRLCRWLEPLELAQLPQATGCFATSSLSPIHEPFAKQTSNAAALACR